MSVDSRVVAMELANQRLMEVQQQMQDEIGRLRGDRDKLTQDVHRLQKELAHAEAQIKDLRDEIRRTAGTEYQGRREITMFGFRRST